MVHSPAFRLPGLEAAAHGDRLRVAHGCERLGREQRADAAGAVEHHGRVAVGHGGLDLLLEVALGDVGGAGDVALLPLGVLAHVDEPRAALDEQLRLRRA